MQDQENKPQKGPRKTHSDMLRRHQAEKQERRQRHDEYIHRRFKKEPPAGVIK